MKNFLSKYWKRILIIIGIILIAINIWSKCVAPRLLIDEYVKYGPNIERNETSINSSLNTSEVITNVSENSPFDDGMTKIILILAAGLILVTVVNDLANKKSGGKKK